MRQIVLDTETTGLDPGQGHRVIEIGCIEIDNRRLTGRHFHCYLNPDREIDEGAVQVHGITSAFLADKPRFNQLADDFLHFVAGAELVIHNAPFDVGFLNSELRRAGGQYRQLEEYCSVVDTLTMARKKHPGQRNSLDALCKRYEVDNSQRDLHGALLDAEILADVYLLMTGGQTFLQLGTEEVQIKKQEEVVRKIDSARAPLIVSNVEGDAMIAHNRLLARINKSSGSRCLWTSSES
ncbi:MAG: DNA polymerase III subunit epsilon [Pseudomonadota bacterium]